MHSKTPEGAFFKRKENTMGLIQYFKDTQAEMRHVAWPTQTQTIVYTALVVLVSIIVSLYVGFFDFLFTRSLEVLIQDGTESCAFAPTLFRICKVCNRAVPTLTDLR